MMFTEYLRSILEPLSILFWVVDPLVAIPIFIAITKGDSLEKKKSTALRASMATWIALSLFAWIGNWIFERWFHVSSAEFRIAGGLILLLTAIDMVRAHPSPSRVTREEQKESTIKEDVSIVPLAIPMLAGPGAMSTVVVLMQKSQISSHPNIQTMGLFIAIFLTGLVSWLLLRSAARAEHFLSQGVIRVFERIMGLFLAAVAASFILGGLRDEKIIPDRSAPSENSAIAKPATTPPTANQK